MMATMNRRRGWTSVAPRVAAAIVILAAVMSIPRSRASYVRSPPMFGGAVRVGEPLEDASLAEFVDAEAHSSHTPSFCHGLDCPKFELDKARTKKLNNTDTKGEFEVRKYGEERWACVQADADENSWGSELRRSFLKLLRYISGENKDKEKIEMTAPVINIVHAEKHGHNNTEDGADLPFKLRTCFYVSPKVKSHPKPLDSAVFMMKTPPTTVAVWVEHGRFERAEERKTALRNLFIALNETKLEHANRTVIFAGYDSPFRQFDLHSELVVPLVV